LPTSIFQDSEYSMHGCRTDGKYRRSSSTQQGITVVEDFLGKRL
jgi:hypothetical protein